MPSAVAYSYREDVGIPPVETDGKESDAMFHPNQIRTGEALALIVPSRNGACLVAGCSCKDARIVSFRRAAFFAAVARRTGETADRIIAPEPTWRLPVAEGV
jgi:hypothetical protein